METKILSAKSQNLIAIFSGVGLLVGLWMAYKGDHKFWGYVGRGLAGSVIGIVAGTVVARITVK